MATNVNASLLLAMLALCVSLDAVQAINTFAANLNVAEEIPPVQPGTTGSGNATVFFAGQPGARTAMQYSLDVVGIPNLKAAHIHEGAKGTNGPVIVYLVGPIANPSPLSTGSLGQGIVTNGNLANPNNEKNLTSIDELYNLVASGNTYVNVHNVQNPGGIVRSQLTPAPENPKAFAVGVPQAYLAAQGQPAAG